MRGRGGPALAEALGVWALLALVALAVVVTYARLPPEELYHTSERGLAGGLGRALVFVNFPVALVAAALAALAADRVGGRSARGLAALAAGLCAVTVAPGVVEQGDLDAKAVNAVPALGVVLALGLTAWALLRRGVGHAPRRIPGDALRLVLAGVLLLASIPWIAADLGFYAGLGGIFRAGEVYPEPGAPTLRAVHLGHHHGLDGALFALAALALTRELALVRGARTRAALAAFLALMLVYGLANALQDFWYEQLVKRGTTSFELPGMLRPALEPAWVAIVAVSAALYALLRRSSAHRPAS